jgi:AraC family transcriptional regulator, regulatory protein of adaptative response / DNA-3-methyladenine glycosylase II
VAAFGTKLEPCAKRDPRLSHFFPTPAQLTEIDIGVLGMPRARAKTLSSMATAVLADPHLLCPAESLEISLTRLRAVPGIGDWTAQYIALRALSEPDAFPASDVALLRAFQDREGRRPTPTALLARAEVWRPWRAYAAQHLWAAGVGGALATRGKAWT